MRLTASIDSGTAFRVSACMSHLKPSRMPTTPMPLTSARIVAAPMTLLMPGAGPPPHRIAIRCESAMRHGNPPERRLFVELGQEFFNAYNHDFARVAVGVPRLQVADPVY